MRTNEEYLRQLLKQWVDYYITGTSQEQVDELFDDTLAELEAHDMSFDTDSDPGDEDGYGSGV